MIGRRQTLGSRLARSIAVATLTCLVAFTAVGAAVWWYLESDAPPAEVLAEGPSHELAESLVLALAIAVPLAIATTVFAARWLTRRATARIDEVTAIARRASARDLGGQLPVSPAGDELDELAVAVNQMLARIDAQIAGQRQFAADASHELRTPLAALRTTLEVARARPRPADEWARTADDALEQIDRMSALVESLIQLARADAAPAERDAVPVREVVERACDTLAASAARKRVTLASRAPDELVVVADPGGLAIALGNLIANAITYAPVDSDVAIDARQDAGDIRIAVVDRGPGVPVADRERIFAPFARGHAPLADRVASGAGVGLGLPIARRIIEAHGGRIEVDDAPGGGARFAVVLPAPRSAPA